MKKAYIAPQTEAMELIASTVLMAGPGGFKNPLNGFSNENPNGYTPQ